MIMLAEDVADAVALDQYINARRAAVSGMERHTAGWGTPMPPV